MALCVAGVGLSGRALADVAGAGTCAAATTAPEAVFAPLDPIVEKVVNGNKYGAAPGGVLSVEGPG
ncbi:MAG: hypothetical protein NTX73_14365 [Rhodobacterales bacterium]|nr:hypothetical protein [Rhodobacterales bacterium]